jgi:hypothetical protein
MPDVRALAEAYGVRVEVTDLGDWGSVTLVAEYDPEGPVIRVNERTLWRILRQAQDDSDVEVTLSLSKGAPQRAIDRVIAHELYHHREAIGEIARIGDRGARERAADAFADDLVRTP